MIQPLPLGHSAEVGESSAAATDVESIAATKNAARTWIPKAGRIAFMALPPAAMMGTARRDNHPARAQWSAPAPTTIARRAPALREQWRAYMVRSRSKRSPGRAKDGRECRAQG